MNEILILHVVFAKRKTCITYITIDTIDIIKITSYNNFQLNIPWIL